MNNVVCIYSGGMDSYTLAGVARSQGVLHSCLSFNYGQRHAKELVYAADVCRDWAVPHHIIDLQNLKPHLLGSALTDAVAVPEGHYAEPNMKLTVVPNRNMIMLSIAIAYAVSHALEEVWFGAHAGDHAIYPDCREEFVDTMDEAARIANWHSVRVVAPFQHMDKEAILRVGMPLGLQYQRSWTCYAGGALACGKCGSCQERLEAFDHLAWTDPLQYETRELMKEGTQ
jgi:7-cyano-7-deazaguanine synthase